MNVQNIKTFVPCKDFQVSQAFYTEIGFKGQKASDQLSLYQNGDALFFLQDFYNEELANNFMLQICVDDIHTAYDICSKAQHKTKISDISEERWGKVFYLWGPSGELLHITELVGPEKI
jgi:hypothetical protein